MRGPAIKAGMIDGNKSSRRGLNHSTFERAPSGCDLLHQGTMPPGQSTHFRLGAPGAPASWAPRRAHAIRGPKEGAGRVSYRSKSRHDFSMISSES
jgi:hypothetical protein